LRKSDDGATELKNLYLNIKNDIDKRLDEFSSLWQKGSNKKIFCEMCFCMCTPQNNAQKAWGAVLQLEKQDKLFNSLASEISKTLKEEGVRFHNNKAAYIAANRDIYYPDTKKIIKNLIADNVMVDVRNHLSKTTKGWGLKEASHFLRNIGFGAEICILDRHIMRQLVSYKVLKAVPKSLTKQTYLSIEHDMISFAKSESIPVDALDLLFWYKAKGELFK
jgi:N-glycosylase/DNA lyase